MNYDEPHVAPPHCNFYFRYHSTVMPLKRLTLHSALNEALALAIKLGNLQGTVHRATDGLQRGSIARQRGVSLTAVHNGEPGLAYMCTAQARKKLPHRVFELFDAATGDKIEWIDEASEMMAVVHARHLLMRTSGREAVVKRSDTGELVCSVLPWFGQYYLAHPAGAPRPTPDEPVERAPKPLPGPVTRIAPPTAPPRCHHGLGFNCPTCWPKPPPIRS